MPPDAGRETPRASADVRGHSPGLAGGAAEPTDAELEAALVRAVLGGHAAVAEELTRQLRARREAAAGNVVRLKTGAG